VEDALKLCASIDESFCGLDTVDLYEVLPCLGCKSKVEKEHTELSMVGGL
jgi:hypothetical protein